MDYNNILLAKLKIKDFNFTERLLQDAGIVSGMKVLDIGCWVGEVSFLVAKLVGELGQIINFYS